MVFTSKRVSSSKQASAQSINQQYWPTVSFLSDVLYTLPTSAGTHLAELNWSSCYWLFKIKGKRKTTDFNESAVILLDYYYLTLRFGTSPLLSDHSEMLSRLKLVWSTVWTTMNSPLWLYDNLLQLTSISISMSFAALRAAREMCSVQVNWSLDNYLAEPRKRLG